MWYSERPSAVSPNISSHRGLYLESRKPTSGMASMIVKPPGESAIPERSAV